jgi:small subunit ribosomal protein S3
MGQKVNPISNRLGIIRGWDSNWYGGNDYSGKLIEDFKIREYLSARLAKASISKIIIERTLKLITVTVNTARPGIIIGKGGQEVDKLKEELKKITQKDVQINIFEVKRPELDAVIVANNLARQIEGKISYGGQSKWLLLRQCVWVQKELRCRSAADWVVQKWQGLKCIRRAVRRFIL